MTYASRGSTEPTTTEHERVAAPPARDRGVVTGLRSAFAFSRRPMAKAAALGTLAAGAEGALALSLGAFAERVASGGPIGWVVAALAGAASLRIVLQVTTGAVAAAAGIDAQRELRRVGLDAILLADARATEPTTDALSRWLDLVPRAVQARQASVGMAAQSVQVVLLAALVIGTSPLLGAAMLGVLLLTGGVATVIVRRVRSEARALAPSHRRIVAILERATRHTLEIRALGTGDVERARLATAVDQHARLQRRLALGNALASASPLIPGVIAIGALATFGVTAGLAASTLIAMLYALVRLSGALAAAGHALGVLAAAGPALAALEIERAGDPPRARRREAARQRGCAIAIERATMELGGRVVLAQIEAQIRAGEVIAIVGPSGAGKTTLLRLVLGLLEPREGRATIDGDDASAWTARASLGLVTAEPFLFAGTLRENLSYGAVDALDDEALFEALARVSASSLVATPGGLDRAIGEGGEGLSFGERQRVALARALASKPALLVLDEPTSGLEPALEIEIAALLRALRGTCTVLVATHRPALIESCQRVLEIIPDGEQGATVRALATDGVRR